LENGDADRGVDAAGAALRVVGGGAGVAADHCAGPDPDDAGERLTVQRRLRRHRGPGPEPAVAEADGITQHVVP
jgi:hypothetical protein